MQRASENPVFVREQISAFNLAHKRQLSRSLIILGGSEVGAGS